MTDKREQSMKELRMTESNRVDKIVVDGHEIEVPREANTRMPHIIALIVWMIAAASFSLAFFFAVFAR